MSEWQAVFLALLQHPAFVPIAVIVLAGGFVRGFVGFGGAVVLILVVSMVFGPREAVAVAALSGLPPMVQLLPAAIRSAERPFVVPFGLASFIGAPLGTYMLVLIAPEVMKIAIALFVIAMVALLYRGNRVSFGNSPRAFAVSGAVAGWIQGIAGVGGPPTVAVALARGGSAEQQRANVIGAVTALNFCTLVPLWWHGLFTMQVIALALLLTPLYSIGTALGQRYFSDQGQRFYRPAALVALATMGIVVFAVAVRDYSLAS